MRIAGRGWKNGSIRTGRDIFGVIPGRERSERTRNLEIPGLVLRTIPE